MSHHLLKLFSPLLTCRLQLRNQDEVSNCSFRLRMPSGLEMYQFRSLTFIWSKYSIPLSPNKHNYESCKDAPAYEITARVDDETYRVSWWCTDSDVLLPISVCLCTHVSHFLSVFSVCLSTCVYGIKVCSFLCAHVRACMYFSVHLLLVSTTSHTRYSCKMRHLECGCRWRH